MNWKERIISKYKIEKQGQFLVQDKKGLLKSLEFLNFLKSKNITYQFVDSLKQLGSISSSNFDGIVFHDLFTITRSIKNKFTNIEVNSYTLPFEVSKEVYELLSVDDYIKLIKHVVEIDYTELIDMTNYKSILNEAKRREYVLKRKTVIKDIDKILEKDISYNDLLLIGAKSGYLEYNDYKYCLEPFSLTDYSKDKISRYILSEDFKNIFFELATTPKSVDKILPHIINKNDKKIALICFDCMGIAEWNLLKDYLSEYDFIEKQLFALIPTITSISRKAILGADHTEIYNNRVSDNKLFVSNFPKNENACLYSSSVAITQDNILGYDKICKIYNLFDDIAHSIVFPGNDKSKKRYFDTVISYLKSSTLKVDLELLKSQKYHLYFCSDHGSIIANGNGIKVDKWLVEESGKRSYIVEDSHLLRNIPFDKYKIPFVEEKYVILANQNEMFYNKNSQGLVHGGISLAELIVPFIEVI